VAEASSPSDTESDSEFDRGIAVSRSDDGPPVSYDAMLSAGWQIGGAVNGGLLLALMGNALRSSLDEAHPDPLSMTAYYVSASQPGPARMTTEVLRSGRTTATCSCSLLQPDGDAEVERVRGLATYGNLSALPDDVRTTATPPDLPPPDECVSTSDAPPSFLAQAGLLERLDLRLDPASAGWAVGKPSRRGRVQGWLRMADGREPDPLLLLLAVDALPPVTFDLGLFGWTPTLELTAHVRAVPAPGWLRVKASTRNVAGGMLEEDAEVWDSADRLVAQSRQLALVPRPHS
jgi:acyl-coenzyme A thioesterase PaaI-like protein